MPHNIWEIENQNVWIPSDSNLVIFFCSMSQLQAKSKLQESRYFNTPTNKCEYYVNKNRKELSKK